MLTGLFNDENGTASSMRVVFSICIVIIFIVWGIVCIKQGTLISFEAIDLGLLGVLFGSKVTQKGFEVWKTKGPASPCSKAK